MSNIRGLSKKRDTCTEFLIVHVQGDLNRAPAQPPGGGGGGPPGGGPPPVAYGGGYNDRVLFLISLFYGQMNVCHAKRMEVTRALA